MQYTISVKLNDRTTQNINTTEKAIFYRTKIVKNRETSTDFRDEETKLSQHSRETPTIPLENRRLVGPSFPRRYARIVVAVVVLSGEAHLSDGEREFLVVGAGSQHSDVTDGES